MVILSQNSVSLCTKFRHLLLPWRHVYDYEFISIISRGFTPPGAFHFIEISLICQSYEFLSINFCFIRFSLSRQLKENKITLLERLKLVTPQLGIEMSPLYLLCLYHKYLCSVETMYFLDEQTTTDEKLQIIHNKQNYARFLIFI